MVLYVSPDPFISVPRDKDMCTINLNFMKFML